MSFYRTSNQWAQSSVLPTGATEEKANSFVVIILLSAEKRVLPSAGGSPGRAASVSENDFAPKA